MSIRHKNTLVATRSSDGDYTVSGCVAGQPIIICHVAKTAEENGWLHFRVKSGASNANGYRYALGTDSYGESSGDGYGAADIVIPTATSVVITFYSIGDDDKALIYKQ